MNKTIAYMLFTTVFVVGVGCLLLTNENMRLRFLVDPFILILVVIFGGIFWKKYMVRGGK